MLRRIEKSNKSSMDRARNRSSTHLVSPHCPDEHVFVHARLARTMRIKPKATSTYRCRRDVCISNLRIEVGMLSKAMEWPVGPFLEYQPTYLNNLKHHDPEAYAMTKVRSSNPFHCLLFSIEL